MAASAKDKEEAPAMDRDRDGTAIVTASNMPTAPAIEIKTYTKLIPIHNVFVKDTDQYSHQ